MSKFDLYLEPPLMNAAGTLGFVPDLRSAVDLTRLGAFVTNPVSLKPRTAANGIRWMDFSGGFLLHTGYPNPGLKMVIRRYAVQWARSPLPVLVHLLASDPAEVASMVIQLEELPGVAGIELGLPPDADVLGAVEFAHAALGELPVVMRLPLTRAAELADELGNMNLSAISLAPPRGALIGPDGELIHGRLYGPAVYPQMLAVVRSLANGQLPVFAAGGVYQPQQVDDLLAMGAAAVQLDAVLWRGGW
jgi:dihydroorotate dehydrogenase (NAD+) catalytic subunit